MVPPSSIRISRVPIYLSLPTRQPFRIRVYHPLWMIFPDHSAKTVLMLITRLIRVRSPLLTESRLISFPPGTEMFQFPGFASLHLWIQCRISRIASGRVSPFGHLRINAYLPAPRSLSQTNTSFIASDCQGIHRMRLFTYHTTLNDSQDCDNNAII